MHTLNVASLNVLALAHVPKGHYTPEALKILHEPRRTMRILDLIKELDADIVGLQEVDQDLLDLLIGTDKWQVFCAPRHPKKVDGCAMLVRHSVFVRESGGTAYSDDSGRAWHYIVVGGIVILNTHIDWAPEDDDNHRGALQMEELLRSVLGRRVVMLGDCNGRPDGKVRTALSEAGFQNLWGDTPTALVRHEDGTEERAAIDLIAVRKVDAVPCGKMMDVSAIPTAACPSDHVPVLATINMR